jgi:hypothetical protein
LRTASATVMWRMGEYQTVLFLTLVAVLPGLNG